MTAVDVAPPAPLARPAGLRSAVVIGGGAVGTLFARHLGAAGISVQVVDRVTGPDGGGPVLVADARHLRGPAIDAVRAADAVVLALPEDVCLQALPALVPALRPGALLVDTLSVKGPCVQALEALDVDGLQVVGVNPMFAPALGFDGRPVLAVVTRPGALVELLLDLLRQAGARVVPCTAAQHDELAAVTQALTHAAVLGVGAALLDLGVTVPQVTAVAPPPHLVLIGLLARIVSGAPEVYWDVQAANPAAARAREALARGLHRVADLVAAGDPDRFAALLQEVRAAFGEELPAHAAACAASLAAVRAPSAPDR